MKRDTLPQINITFEQLCKRVGFGLAVCICDKELDEKFWLSLNEEQQVHLLELALSNEVCPRWMHAPVRGDIGGVVIMRYAKDFSDWLTAYNQISQLGKKDQQLRKVAVKKLRELAVTFDDWSRVRDSCRELKCTALNRMCRLATTRKEHLEVMIALSGLTMQRVNEMFESEELKLGRELEQWKKCNLAKEIELVTDQEKHHWDVAFSIRDRFDKRNPPWREIWEELCQVNHHPGLYTDFHPIACKALRESETQARNSH